MNTIGPTGANSVRIDGSYIPDPRKPQEDRAASARRPGDTEAGASVGGAEVISSQERLITDAGAVAEVNTQAVAEAKALLESGALDTPEAAGRAAKAMLDIGL